MYEKSKQKFNFDHFVNPPSEYRGAPFWAWNDKLENDELCRQIDEFTEMGFGGFNMHARQGLSTPYLEEEFMEAIKTCVQKAKETGTYAWLYDEDRFPSGFAGGIVTKDPEFRVKMLVFSTEKDKAVFENKAFSEYVINGYQTTPTEVVKSKTGYRLGKPYLLAIFDVVLDDNGIMTSYEPIGLKTEPKGKKVYAYVRTLPALEGWNNTNIADMMHEKAVDKFIECTYQKYYDEVGEDFGGVIPAIFTDEPQVAIKRSQPYALGEVNTHFSWTTDFPLTFAKDKGYDLVPRLPELVWNMQTPSKARYDYFDHQAERLKNAYADKIGDWCKKHNILFSGHYAQEDSLLSQSEWVGEVMRLYDKMGVPGMDLLANRNGYIVAKQVISTARQNGVNTVLSELYGVTGWDFDFRGHKYQGDWHSCIGVTVRVPHLSWYSMKGIAKRDYPASISYQSSWFKQYKYLEDHFSRLNLIMSRGKPDVKVAVVHPIDSYWLNYGPNDITGQKRKSLDNDFKGIATWLIENGVDFDFISESTLPKKLKPTKNKTLKVGEMEYSTVIVLPVDTLRSTTVDALEKFAKRGGNLVMTNKPTCIDGVISNGLDNLYGLSKKIAFNKNDILQAVDNERNIKIKLKNGFPAENYMMQRRLDDDCEWVMIASTVFHDGRQPEPPKAKRPDNLKIIIDGNYFVTVYNTLNGTTEQANFEHVDGKTIVYYDFYQADSLLLQLKQTKRVYKTLKSTVSPVVSKTLLFNDGVEYSTNEPNVLVLDQAEWSKDGKKWNELEEVLKINEILRKERGYIPEAEGISQPYIEPHLKAELYPYLKFTFNSQVSTKVKLAFEDATEIKLNGKKVKIQTDGYYTDRQIKTTSIGKIKKGKNTVIVRAPFGKYISLENMFLLGEFGVSVKGARAEIIKKPKKVHFSSLTHQGFPFYGGVITYKLPFTLDVKSKINVLSEKYSGALITARLDQKDIGKIIFSPYSINGVEVDKGKHLLELDLYLSRVNSFGTLHGCSFIEYQGPDAWATSGFNWSYEYVLKDGGILKSPAIEILEK
ncbi:MAG: hypothetical protein J6R83_04325 [Clostridia bacterium]|nr:hypothetical protein [Clostridia bacterium]